MRFTEPSVLYFLSFVPLLFFALLLAGRKRLKSLREFGNPSTLDRFSTRRISAAAYTKSYRTEGLFIALALFFFILALAKPQAGTRLEPVQIRGSDIYIAIDMSKSMRAEDVKPSRFDRAKIDALELIKSLKGDRVGLIVFGSDAYVQCPLTSDYEAVFTFISALDLESAVASGSSVAAPLSAAISFIRPEEDTYTIVLLLTDGEDTVGGWSGVTKELGRRSIKVFCVGIGTREGSPIPVFDESGRRTGYLKDSSGNVVISKLNDALLKEIAERTQGYYFETTSRVSEVGKFTATIASMKKRDLDTKRYTVYEERFQFPLAAGIVFLILYMLKAARNKREEA